MRTTGSGDPDFAGAMHAARRPTGLVLGTLVAVAATALLFALGPLLRYVIPEDVRAQAGVLAITPAFLSTWVLLWVWLRAKEGRRFRTIGLTLGPSRTVVALRMLRGVVLALAQFGVYLIVGFSIGAFTVVEAPAGGILDLAALGWVLIAIPAFAMQSGAEEIVARGYLVQVWYPRTGVAGALIVSAIYFTVGHSLSGDFPLLSAIDMTLYSVLAVFWALTERGLWGIIAYHATWNWVQGSLFGVAVSGTEAPDALISIGASPDAPALLTGGAYGAEGSLVDIIVLLVLIGGAVTAWARSRRRTAAG